MSENETKFLSFVVSGVEKKRGVGRPRKNKCIIPTLKVEGYGKEPMVKNNIIELIHARPKLFKNIVMHCKELSSQDLVISFESKSINFYTTDHVKIIRSVGTISCDKMNWYHCSKPTIIVPDISKFRLAFANINDEYYGVMICIDKELELTAMLLYQATYQKIETSRIDCTEAKNTEIIKKYGGYLLPSFIENMPITFTMDPKLFKADLMKLSKIDDKFTIEKLGREPLCLSAKSDKMTKTIKMFDEKSLKLSSKIGPKQYFSCDSSYKVVKNAVQTGISDYITVSCNADNIISFEYIIDEVVEKTEKTVVAIIRSVVDRKTV